MGDSSRAGQHDTVDGYQKKACRHTNDGIRKTFLAHAERLRPIRTALQSADFAQMAQLPTREGKSTVFFEPMTLVRYLAGGRNSFQRSPVSMVYERHFRAFHETLAMLHDLFVQGRPMTWRNVSILCRLKQPSKSDCCRSTMRVVSKRRR
jgi:hypothetical protein